jgi:hypothetical protein
MHGDTIWFRDPARTLLRPVLIPRPHMSLEGKLNALVRFAIVYSIALVAFGKLRLAFFALAVTLLLTYAIYWAEAAGKAKLEADMERLSVEIDPATKELRVVPTPTNPFMNKLTLDAPTRPPAADITRDAVAKRAELAFFGDKCRDPADIFNRSASSRQFYTMPVTQTPNRRDEYAEWLFSEMPPKHNKF